MRILLYIFILSVSFLNSSATEPNSLTKEQIQFLQILKASLEQKEILKYLKKNDFIIDGNIYVVNQNSPLKGLKHTLKLKSGEFVKIQNREDLFFYAIKKHLAVSEYEVNENNSRLILNHSGNSVITTTLEFNRGWMVTDHSIEE